jgi:transcriptional regulator with XRE-family HTH domain
MLDPLNRDTWPNLLTQEELAAALIVSPKTLRKWQQVGSAPREARIPGKARWTKDAVIDWLRKGGR